MLNLWGASCSLPFLGSNPPPFFKLSTVLLVKCAGYQVPGAGCWGWLLVGRDCGWGWGWILAEAGAGFWQAGIVAGAGAGDGFWRRLGLGFGSQGL